MTDKPSQGDRCPGCGSALLEERRGCRRWECGRLRDKNTGHTYETPTCLLRQLHASQQAGAQQDERIGALVLGQAQMVLEHDRVCAQLAQAKEENERLRGQLASLLPSIAELQRRVRARETLSSREHERLYRWVDACDAVELTQQGGAVEEKADG